MSTLFPLRNSRRANFPDESHPRIFWLLSGDETIASSRLQGYLIHRHLLKRGIDSHLLLAPPFKLKTLPWKAKDEADLAELCGTDIVVLQKLRGELAYSLAGALRRSGAITVYIDCDYRLENKVGFECNVIVCPSETLANFYRESGAQEVVCIHDPAEFWNTPEEIFAHHAKISPTKDNLKLCWIGDKANWPTLKDLQTLLREPEFADFQLVTVSNHPDADIVWSLDAVQQVVRECDIGVVPTIDGFKQAVKSSNRIVLCMATGLPVIAGRIPSYEEIIKHGETGLFANSPEEWREALCDLRDSNRRQTLSTNAYKEVREQFSIESIVTRWLTLFEDLYARNQDIQVQSPTSITEEKKELLMAKLITQAQLVFAEEALKHQSSKIFEDCLEVAHRAAKPYPALRKDVRTLKRKVIRQFIFNTLNKIALTRIPVRIMRAIIRRLK